MSLDLAENINLKKKNNAWKSKPTAISTWDYRVCDYVMFIDENNTSKTVEKVREAMVCGGTISQDERFFTITGCIFKQQDYAKAKYKFEKLKRKYWKNGMWLNPKINKEQPVCFHSIEIRNKKNAFKLEDEYNNFIVELDTAIKETDYIIVSISIDLVEYIWNTSYDLDVYDIAFDFILERFIYELKSHKGMIMLESRGKKEDAQLLKHIVQKFEDGFKYITPDKIKQQIIGVYFNQKFNSLTSYPIIGLELADLSSYPIHKFVKYGKKDLSFETLEKKLRNYPSYNGRGLKIYPKTSDSNFAITFRGLIKDVE